MNCNTEKDERSYKISDPRCSRKGRHSIGAISVVELLSPSQDASVKSFFLSLFKSRLVYISIGCEPKIIEKFEMTYWTTSRSTGL